MPGPCTFIQTASKKAGLLYAVVVVILWPLVLIAHTAGPGGSIPAAPRVRNQSHLPLYFERNAGQADEEARFIARVPGGAFFLTRHAIVLAAQNPAPDDPAKGQPATPAVLRMKFAGKTNPSNPVGHGELSGKANYFIGSDPRKWLTHIPLFHRVEYPEIYPGISAMVYGNPAQLEYDFLVQPGADPRLIVLRFEGARSMEIDSQGDLLLHFDGGLLRQRKPVIYQMADGVREEVSGNYVFRGTKEIGFQISSFDTSRALVIDPVLLFSTFLGGSGQEFATSIAVDSAGNSYLGGYTLSADFPLLNPAQGGNAGGQDAFITKLNPTGTGIVYSTYIGGSGADQAPKIAIDAAGNAYLAGSTVSADFPVTPGAFDTSFSGVEDAYVVKLTATGDTIVFGTYLGGATDSGAGEGAADVAVDAAGNVYVGGFTRASDFPTTPGAFQTGIIGFRDIFVTKLNSAGNGLVYSTYVGSSEFDELLDLTVDSSGQVLFTGRVFNSGNHSIPYPTTPGAFDSTFDNIRDAVVTKLNATGSALVYSTLLGGTDFDEAFGIAQDATGYAYVVGWTFSGDFPTAGAPFQNALAGSKDCFVSKVNPSGTALVYSTFLGGNEGAGTEVCRGVAVDSTGHAYVVGQTESGDFPTASPFQSANAGGADAFVSKISPDGSSLVYSSYLGGQSADDGSAIGLDSLPNPNAYVLGHTSHSSFPVTPGVVQPAFAGGQDAFIAKIGDIVLPPSVGKVTGGGKINISGGTATFGFVVQRESATAPIEGNFQYVNHANGTKLKSVAIDTFTLVGNTSTFSGTCTLDGVPCTFSVNLTDNGEPGRDDVLTAAINGGPADGGVLRTGNVKIHAQ
jgi:hypothetical protein